jgi:UPF0755 protein
MSFLKSMTEQKKIKNAYRAGFVAAGVFLLAAVFCLMVLRALLMPVNVAHVNEVSLVVPRNASTAQIASLLKEKGIIKNAPVFRLYARMRGVDGKLKPGRYTFNTAMSISGIIDELVKGPPDRVKLTVPEGYTVQQIADLLEKKGIAKREDFTRALKKQWDFSFLEHVPVKEAGLEGYLYPDTYYLGSNSSAEDIVEMMLRKFDSVIRDHNYAERAASMGLTLHEAVTIASMVEREARVESERPRIAGVIFNRLKLGMPLQIDATVQYALGKPKEKLFYRDLEVDSPYNTYKVNGLPPGPIANPGWPSLKAVIEPERNDFLYYVARPDGTHAFARTLSEHNRNVQKYQ